MTLVHVCDHVVHFCGVSDSARLAPLVKRWTRNAMVRGSNSIECDKLAYLPPHLTCGIE